MENVDILILTWNSASCIKDCLDYIKKNTFYPEYQIKILDNGSSDGTVEILKEYRDIYLITLTENVGISRGLNILLKTSKTDYVVVIDDDTLVKPNWLSRMVAVARANPFIGVVNPIQDKVLDYNTGEDYMSAKRIDEYVEVGKCDGFCMLIKRKVIDKVGYFDERFGLYGHQDEDYSRRAQLAGFPCVVAPGARVYHPSLKGREYYRRKKNILRTEKIFEEKWGKPLRIVCVPGEKFMQSRTFSESLVEMLYLLARGRGVIWAPVVRYSPDEIKGIYCSLNRKVHTEIRFTDFSAYYRRGYKLFLFYLLYRILKKTRRKRFRMIFTGDEKSARFFLNTRWLHRLPVFLFDGALWLIKGKYAKERMQIDENLVTSLREMI